MGEQSPPESGTDATHEDVERPARESAGGPVGQAPQLDPRVPERQWGLPVGFSAGREQPVTLRELAEGAHPLLPADSLTDAQRTWLVTNRILSQDKFSLSVYGVGVIDKERAAREVEEGSRVGRSIAQVELMMVQEMIGLATGK